METDDLLLIGAAVAGVFIFLKTRPATTVAATASGAPAPGTVDQSNVLAGKSVGVSAIGALGLPISAMSAADQSTQMNHFLSVGFTATQIQAQVLSDYNKCISSGLQWTATGCSRCANGMQFKPVPAGFTGAATIGPDGSPWSCF